MSEKERRRLELLARVRDRQATLVKASELMGLSYRQAKRVWRRYRQEGDCGLVHRLRGRASGRAIDPAIRQAVLRRYRETYEDFGPTLAAEHLGGEGWRVVHETLRRWLIAAGLWQRRRKRPRHRQWRARKEHAGELVQMDGSHHDWFEGRRGPAVLMVMVDDATNRTYARFFEGETTAAAMETFERYTLRHGLPQALYVDLDSIWHSSAEPTLEEQRQGQRPQTQFGRAMQTLGVRIVLAYSPQAKGRVERRNGLLQDRLVKELRLAGISELAAANVYLEKQFLPRMNRQFTVTAVAQADLHRAVPAGVVLAEVLSHEERRVVARDWTVSWRGRYLQLTRDNSALPPSGKSITVRQLRDGRLQLLWRDQKLRWRPLPQRPQPQLVIQRLPKPRLAPPQPTAKDHPWRRFGIASGRPFWAAARAAGASPRPCPATP
jgi:molybdenum-dependent DNA-binding transcriptional regulator ModE